MHRATRAKHPLARVDTINHAKSTTSAAPTSDDHTNPSKQLVQTSSAVEEDDDDEANDIEVEEEEFTLEDEYSEEEEAHEDDAEMEGIEHEIEDEEDGSSEHEQDDQSSDDGEAEAIAQEMAELEMSVPRLARSYKLVDRLGEGTFSSVYKALDIHHFSYANDLWALPNALTPRNPATGLRDPSMANEAQIPPLRALREQERKGRVYVALKRIYVTSSPERIQNELQILRDLRGATNIAYLIDAIRHEDQVLAVMPYSRHQDFREYYRNSPLPLLRSYFASLFRALHSTHLKHILHRDVKPANFLYDIHTGVGILCDFGLAERLMGVEWKAECLHGFPGAGNLHGEKLAKPISLYDQFKKQNADWAEKKKKWDEGGRKEAEKEKLKRELPLLRGEMWEDELRLRKDETKGWYRSWGRDNESSNGKMAGYLKEDPRPSVRANRAGTRGFRAPEVLFKCPDQTVALDIWSAGIIFLCFLTRRFPFFNSNDDIEALAEITAIFGRNKIQKCASIHNRNFLTNIPTFDVPPHPSFHALVKSLNPAILVENSPNPHGAIPSTDEEDAQWYNDSELFLAVDLMKRCLELDLTRRWTAERCLEHPFFDGEYDLGGGRRGPRGPMHSAVKDWEF